MLLAKLKILNYHGKMCKLDNIHVKWLQLSLGKSGEMSLGPHDDVCICTGTYQEILSSTLRKLITLFDL